MNFDKEQYFKEGYTVQPNLVSQEIIEELNAEIDRITRRNTLARHNKLALEMEPDQPPTGNLVRRIYAPCKHYPAFNKLSVSDQVLDRIEELVGPDIILHYSKLNMKPPGIGTKIKWHQDFPFYPMTNTKTLALLIYLEDATTENGCLQVVPQNEKQEILDHAQDGYFAGAVAEDMEFEDAVPLEGTAGTGIFMNGLTLHASAKNLSGKGRRTLIIGYRAASAIPLYYGEMTNMMERESKLVRGIPNPVAEVTIDRAVIPVYKENISSIYDLQKN